MSCVGMRGKAECRTVNANIIKQGWENIVFLHGFIFCFVCISTHIKKNVLLSMQIILILDVRNLQEIQTVLFLKKAEQRGMHAKRLQTSCTMAEMYFFVHVFFVFFAVQHRLKKNLSLHMQMLLILDVRNMLET